MTAPARFSRFTAGTSRLVAHPLTPLVLLALGVVLLVFNLARNRFFFHDDAYISLRYALNLVEHGDLSWNVGDRVEGYTNFLHILAVSGLLKLGLEPTLAARAVNAAGALAFFAAVFVGCRKVAPNSFRARALSALATLSSYALVIWVLGGLETVLATAFLAWALVALVPLFQGSTSAPHLRALAAGVCFSLAYLTRPDSLMQCAAAGAALLMLVPGSEGRRGSLGAVLRKRSSAAILLAIPPAATIGAHLAWRLQYYGDNLPNTFYAKVGVPLGIRLSSVYLYLPKATVLLPAVSFAVLCAFLAMRFSRRATRTSIFLLSVLGLHLSYVLWSGGDHMPAARVLVPLLAPATLLLAASLENMPRPRRHLAIGAGALFLAACTLASPSLKEDPPSYVGTITAKYIRETWPAGSLIALSAAGATPFHATEMTYIDMLGLSDRTIGKREDFPLVTPRQRWPGHAKGDGAYILRRQPDFIILGIAEGLAKTRPWFLSDVELGESPEFLSCYRARRVEIPYQVPEPRRQEVINPLRFIYYERTCAKTG